MKFSLKKFFVHGNCNAILTVKLALYRFALSRDPYYGN